MVSGVGGSRLRRMPSSSNRRHASTGYRGRGAGTSMLGSSPRNSSGGGRYRKMPFTAIIEKFTGGNPLYNIIVYTAIICAVVLRKMDLGTKSKISAFFDRFQSFHRMKAPVDATSITTEITKKDERNSLFFDYQKMLTSLRDNYAIDESSRTASSESEGNILNVVSTNDFESPKSVIDMKRRFWMTFHSILDSTQSSFSVYREEWIDTKIGSPDEVSIEVSSCSNSTCGSDGKSIIVMSNIFIKASPDSIISIIHPKRWRQYRQLRGTKFDELSQIYFHGGGSYQSLLSITDDFEIGRKYTTETDTANNDVLCVSFVRTLPDRGKGLAMLNIDLEGVGQFRSHKRTSQDVLFTINTPKADEQSQYVDLKFIGRYDIEVLSNNSSIGQLLRTGIGRELIELKRVSELHAKVVEEEEFSEL